MDLRKTLLAAGLCAGFSVHAFAASQAECAIWLCLPGGFPAAGLCPAAHAAMLARIAQFKPPLPVWGSCSTNDGAGPDVNVALGYDNWQDCPEGTVSVPGYRREGDTNPDGRRRYCAEPRVLECLENRYRYTYVPDWCNEASIFGVAWREDRCYVDVRIRQDDGANYYHRAWYRSRRCAQ